MHLAIVVVFILGYLGIAFEHKLRIDKASFALLIGGICWTLLIFTDSSVLGIHEGLTKFEWINLELSENLSDIASILFFLLGAMTIVEVIDSHDGFVVVTQLIHTKNKVVLLWVVSFITFFLSAVLDNLTTAIIMAAVLRKLIAEKEELFQFGGMVVLAANAGGAWSPIGDVTTIMLWVGGQVTAPNIVAELLIPSLVCLIVPLLYLSFKLKGSITTPDLLNPEQKEHLSKREMITVLSAGVASLLFVPVFKTVTHLPPYLGMIISLGVMWIGSDILRQNREKQDRQTVTMIGVLKKLDLPTLFFFLGILLAVGALETSGYLGLFATYLDENLGNILAINFFIGVFSSVVDNVPLVAGAIGMYPLDLYEVDHVFWELLAYCAGTGGSILIIGSAAGVAIMGIMKIDFIWYVKKISLLAFLGYVSGMIAFYLMNRESIGSLF